MNKTKIEWCDYTLNPVKGLCPMACSYCYARAMYKRFKWNPEIRFDWNFTPPRKPSRIFVGSTMELFGEWVPDSWLRNIFNFCSQWPNHTFLFLTKQPQNLIKFSPFPPNCFVGATVTDRGMFIEALRGLKDVRATVRYISIEPCLERIISDGGWIVRGAENIPVDDSFMMTLSGISWIIIGAQTKPYKPPKIEWVEEIVKAADKAGIPVFLKNNLMPCVAEKGMLVKAGNIRYGLRQEMPNEVYSINR